MADDSPNGKLPTEAIANVEKPVDSENDASLEDAQATATDEKRTEVAVASSADSTQAARLARFAALKKRTEQAKKDNLKEVQAEAKRLATDPSLLSKLEQKRALAEHKLLKDETPDFERKRNWDYTAEESEKWDKRLAKKARNRDNNLFADYGAEANKTYKRTIKELGAADRENYLKNKEETMRRQVASGELQVLEDDDGELYTINSQGQVNTPNPVTTFDHKPTEAAIDRLVANYNKSEKQRLAKRAARGLKDDSDKDVTFINEKNKQFNDKLARFYNRYTTEIRESFERGTAI